MKQNSALKAADNNKYSWNMDFFLFENNKGYEARFYKCGICVLMNEVGLKEYIHSMCRLDYDMAEATKVTNFKREYTLASGGPYCDCGYYRK